MGAAILRTSFPSIELVRSRDDEVLQKLPLVFDVGSEYAPELGRFDHHQKGGAGERDNGSPYASSGLLWKEFGPALVRSVASGYTVDFAALAARLDTILIQQIDEHDCGTSKVDPEVLTFPRSIELLNPPPGAPSEQVDLDFMNAVEIAGVFLSKIILQEASRMVAADLVRKSYRGGAVLELAQDVPWEEVVVNELPDVTLVIIPKRGDRFNVKTVPVQPGAFEHRQLLPTSWAGLEGDDLAQASGVSDALFCHNARFIAVSSSLAGARELASIALTHTS